MGQGSKFFNISKRVKLASLGALLAISVVCKIETVHASTGVTYQGRILKPDGSALTGSNVQFRLQIRTPGSQNCLMYEEQQALDMSESKGNFSLTINDGSGIRNDTTGFGLDRVFSNRLDFSFDPSSCSIGSVYSPSPDDGRKLVVYFKDETMSAWEPMPAQNINFVPNAIQAMNVGGYDVGSLLRFAESDGTLVNTSPLSNAQYTELLAVLAGTSTQYERSGQLGGAALPTLGAAQAGQVLSWNGTGWETTSSSGVTADSVTSATIVNGTITGADLSSSIAINTTSNISSSGTVSSNVTTARDFRLYDSDASPDENYISLKAPTSLSANYNYVWPLDYGTANQVLTSDGAGGLTWAAPVLSNVSTISNPTSSITLTSAAGNSVIVSQSTVSTSSTTGALVVNGGVGVAGAINAAGNISSGGTVSATNSMITPQIYGSSAASGNIKIDGTSDATKGNVLLASAGGNVGIGTTSPSANLEIGAASGSNSNFNMSDEDVAHGMTSLTSTSTYLKIGPYSSTKGGGDINGYNDDGTATALSLSGVLGSAAPTATVPAVKISGWKKNGTTFQALGNSETVFQVANGALSTPITVLGAGYVGIGTTSPARLLHVNGPIRLAASAAPSTPATGDVYVDSSDSNKLKWYDGSAWQAAGGSSGSGTPGGSNTQLQFNSSGAFAGDSNLIWDNTNKRLGVKTASPSASLSVDEGNTENIIGGRAFMGGWSGGSTEAAFGHYYTIGSNTDFAVRQSDVGRTVVNSASGSEIQFSIANDEKMRVASDGNVGIGTTNPATKLEVSGTIRVGDGAETCGASYTGGIRYNGGNLQFCNGTAWTTLSTGTGSGDFKSDGTVAMTGQLQAVAGTNGAPSYTFDGDEDTGIYNYSAGGFAFTGNGTQRIRFTPAGDINSATGEFAINGASSAATPTYGFRSSSGLGVYRAAADTLGFTTSSSERMRIDSAGNVGIGTTSPSYKLDVAGDLRITGTPYRDGGDVAWTVSSDARLKDVTAEYTRGLREIASLETIKFRYKAGNAKGLSSTQEYTGVIAQEAQKQIPEAVKEDKDGFLSLNTTPIFWAMVNAIKDLYREIIAVKSDVEAKDLEIEQLKKENAEFKARLEKIEKAIGAN